MSDTGIPHCNHVEHEYGYQFFGGFPKQEPFRIRFLELREE